MKFRNGFVSNSSSSSFICSVCSYESGGHEVCLADFDMFECTNDHTTHIHCAPNFKKPENSTYNSWSYGVSPEMCPACQFTHITEKDELHYLKAKLTVTSQEILEEIKTTFGTYQTYKNWRKFQIQKRRWRRSNEEA